MANKKQLSVDELKSFIDDLSLEDKISIAHYTQSKIDEFEKQIDQQKSVIENSKKK